MATGLAIGYLIGGVAVAASVYVAIDARRQAERMAEEAKKNSRKAQKQMFKAAAAPKQIVLGNPVLSGPMVFAAEEGSPNDEGVGEWVHIVVHLAGHPCHDVTRAWLDDVELNRFSGSNDYQVEFRHPNGEGWVYLYLGTHTAVPSTLSHLPDFEDSMKGLGDCFAHIKLRSNPEKWTGGIPNPKFAVKGLEVFDPRTNRTEWTDNPALLMRWYRNVLKQGVADDEAYIIAANLCNEHITIPGTVGEKRYRCNYAFQANESPRTVMNTIRATCAGTSLRVAGRHSLQVGAYYGPGTVVLTEDDIVGDITTQADVRKRDRINTVTAKYTDPEMNWNEVDMPQIQNAQFVAEDGGFEIASDLDLTAVPSPYQAQRLAWIYLNTKREAMTIEFTCNLKAVQLLPGVVFRLNFTENAWSNVEFIVTSWKFSNENGVTLTAMQHYANQYAWDGSQAIAPERPGLPSVIDPKAVEPVSNLTYTTLADSNTLQAVITWKHRSFGGIKYELSFYQGGHLLRTEESIEKQYRLQDGFAQGTYEVRVRAINAYGSPSSVSSLVFSTRAPQTPTDIKVNAGNWALELEPVPAGSINFDTMYDFAYGFSADADDTAVEKHIAGRAKVLTISNLRADTEYHIAVREVSRWGYSGWYKKTARTGFNSDDVLEVIHGQITQEALDDSLKGALNQKEKRAIDIGNLLADESRLTEGLRAAYQEFKDKQQAAKTEVGFAYAERNIKKHADQFGVVAEEIAQLAAIDGKNLAHSLEYTRTAVGYCIDEHGNITDHNNAVMCVQAGNSWVDGPLAEFIRNLQIQTASGDKASIGSMMQVFEKEDDGGLVARGSMTSDVNGKITGFINTNDGQKTQLDFIADQTRIGILDDDGNFQSLFWLNAQNKTLSIKAQLILADGHTVTNVDDIRGQNGLSGSGRYALPLRGGIFPSDAVATGDFTQHVGRAPVLDDLLSYYSTDKTTVSTKSYDGSAWVAPQMLLDGNLIALGSIRGDRFVADTEIASPLIKGGQGYFGVGGPYDNYHTRIDANGTIRTNRLYMKSAETGGRTEYEPTRVSVYDNANTLRVRFGRLT